MDPNEGLVCPKCGQPREAEAVDCPYCGIVYARWRGAPDGPPAAGGAEPAAETPHSPDRSPHPAEPAGGLFQPEPEGGGDLYEGPAPGDLYEGGGLPPEPAAGDAASQDTALLDTAPGSVGGLYAPQPAAAAAEDDHVRDTLLGRNLGFSLLAVGVVYLLLQGVWVSVMFGGSANLDNARTQFQRLSGFQPPPECDEAVIFNLAGRRFVLIEESDEAEGELAVATLLFHPGGLGDEVPAAVLLARVRGRLDALGVPYRQLRSRRVTVEGQPATAVTFGLGPQGHERARVFALAFRARDGKQSLLVLAGPSTRVALVSRRWLLG